VREGLRIERSRQVGDGTVRLPVGGTGLRSVRAAAVWSARSASRGRKMAAVAGLPRSLLRSHRVWHICGRLVSAAQLCQFAEIGDEEVKRPLYRGSSSLEHKAALRGALSTAMGELLQ